MKDAISILLATSVLALGGLGLYFYKSSDLKGGSYDEEEIFKDNDDDDLTDEDEEYEKKPKKQLAKTKRNRKGSGTKRRY
jgi:hypothetical protein